jgi:hypothetical protein
MKSWKFKVLMVMVAAGILSGYVVHAESVQVITVNQARQLITTPNGESIIVQCGNNNPAPVNDKPSCYCSFETPFVDGAAVLYLVTQTKDGPVKTQLEKWTSDYAFSGDSDNPQYKELMSKCDHEKASNSTCTGVPVVDLSQ